MSAPDDPARRYFVTGTDTGVGKTFVTAALARRARALGGKALAFKPIETGCHGPSIGEDQAALVDAAGGWQEGEARGIYQFAQPAAPLVAARAEGRTIDLEHIRSVLAAIEGSANMALVEGAGGLRVPITESADMATLARLLDLPLLIVARAGLGTINHSLLTIEAAEHEGLKVRALVLSRRPEDDAAFAESNAAEIRRRWPKHVLVFDGEPSQLDVLF
jgi:dethiobiotin synthetase